MNKNIKTISMMLVVLGIFGMMTMSAMAATSPTSSASSTSSIKMSVTYPVDYTPGLVNGVYVQYIKPIAVKVLDSKNHPKANVKIVFTAKACDHDSTACSTYKSTKYTNSQGQVSFTETLPYLVQNVYITVNAYNSAGAKIASSGHTYVNIGD